MANNITEVDFVYLWVDGNDPAWQAKRNAVIGKTDSNPSADCKGRYADNDELKYSLRSLEKYAPWIRNIFIVTDNQVPKWLDTSNPKIKIIDHTEILPAQSLPCFNSCLIEHYIWRIPGLSEHFLYGNDDLFINRPVQPSDFFDKNGRPIIRLNRRPFRRLTLFFREKIQRKPLGNYVITIRNAAELVNKKYGIYYGGKTHHNIDAYLKSNYQHVWEVFKDEIEATSQNHIRSANDIQRNIYSYVPLAEGCGHLQYVTQKTSFRFHIHRHNHYKKLERYNPMLFCMNDSEFANDDDRARATAFLEKYFPEKSQFEK